MGCVVRGLGEGVPPMLLPEAASPIANPIFVLKYVGRMATEGTNNMPPPSPITKPWASSACQNSVHRLSIMKPKTTPKLPMSKRRRRCPRSKMGPVQAPTKRTHTDLSKQASD